MTHVNDRIKLLTALAALDSATGRRVRIETHTGRYPACKLMSVKTSSSELIVGSSTVKLEVPSEIVLDDGTTLRLSSIARIEVVDD